MGRAWFQRRAETPGSFAGVSGLRRTPRDLNGVYIDWL